MRFGVVVTDDTYATQVIGILQAAVKRGWDLRCFLTDTGVRLLNNSQFTELALSGQVATALCELSVERYEGIDLASIADKVVVGGQYQDAELVKNSDQVLVF
ncbi:MAG: DsrE family protein [Thiohalomonadaceae bacterium]